MKHDGDGGADDDETYRDADSGSVDDAPDVWYGVGENVA